MQHKIDALLKLEEENEKAKRKLFEHQVVVKRWFVKQVVGSKDFQVGDLVIKWDKVNETKGKDTKF